MKSPHSIEEAVALVQKSNAILLENSQVEAVVRFPLQEHLQREQTTAFLLHSLADMIDERAWAHASSIESKAHLIVNAKTSVYESACAYRVPEAEDAEAGENTEVASFKTFAYQRMDWDLLEWFSLLKWGSRKRKKEIERMSPPGEEQEGETPHIIEIQEDEVNAADIEDILADEAPLSDDQTHLSNMKQKLTAAINTRLDKQERYLIIHHYGLNDCEPLTLKAIAKDLALKYDTVTALHTTVLNILKAELE